MKTTSLLLALVSVSLNAAAQLALKQGTRVLGMGAATPANGWTVLRHAAVSPWVWTGLGAYVLSVGLWIVVLSRLQVSYAYPLVSIGYVLAAVAAWTFWHEDLSAARIVGIAVICVGVVLVARS